MSPTFEQNLDLASGIIRAAESSLGRLTPGQRRDLVADRTDLATDYVAELVAAYDWPFRPGDQVAYASDFLRSIHADHEARGRTGIVLAIGAELRPNGPRVVTIRWNGALTRESKAVLSCNLRRLPQPRGVPDFFAWWGANMDAYPTNEEAQTAYVIEFGEVSPAGVSSLPTARLLRVLELIQEANGDPENAALADKIRGELARRLATAG